METKPARAKEFQSKLAAYSATATAALLAAPAVTDAGTIQNITSITPASTLSWTIGGGMKSQAFTAGPFCGIMLGVTGSTDYSNRFYHRATALLQSSNHNGHALTNDGEIKRFGFGALPRGATGNALLAKQSQRYGSGGGNFLPPANGAVTGYIGFKEQLNAHTYYGWLRIQVDADANGFPDEILLIAKSGDPDIYGAYGLASDDITAGEIASPVPEPSLAALGGLGLLALGARGMREMRRRKTSTAPV